MRYKWVRINRSQIVILTAYSWVNKTIRPSHTAKCGSNIMGKLVLARFGVDAGRIEVEKAEGKTFNNREELESIVGCPAEFICRISEFIDDLNDGEYPTESWVTYCYIKEGNF